MKRNILLIAILMAVFVGSFAISTVATATSAASMVPPCDCRIHNHPTQEFGRYDEDGVCQPVPCSTPIE